MQKDNKTPNQKPHKIVLFGRVFEPPESQGDPIFSELHELILKYEKLVKAYQFLIPQLPRFPSSGFNLLGPQSQEISASQREELEQKWINLLEKYSDLHSEIFQAQFVLRVADSSNAPMELKQAYYFRAANQGGFFIAYALEVYRFKTKLTLEELATRLGLDLFGVYKLGIYPHPSNNRTDGIIETIIDPKNIFGENDFALLDKVNTNVFQEILESN